MKKNEVVVGGSYVAKVSGKLVPVRITGESKFGGWDAVNTQTNRAVRIKSAQRLRRPADAATKKAVASDNPLVQAEASEFTELLGKVTIDQLTDALAVKTLSAKKRSRIEAALANRTRKVDDAIADGRKAAAEGVAKTVAAVETGDLTKGVEVPTAATKKPAAKVAKAPGKMSGLDAAARVLAESAEPLNAKQIVEAMAAKGYWSSNAATPHATIYAGMLIEARKKGGDSRFAKVGRGQWGLTAAGKQAK